MLNSRCCWPAQFRRISRDCRPRRGEALSLELSRSMLPPTLITNRLPCLVHVMAAARQVIARSSLRSSQRLVLPSVLSSSSVNVRPCASAIVATRLPSSTWASSSGFHSTALRLSKETSWASKGDIGYKEVKSISDAPTGEVTIIDVREPDEVSAGMIPSAVNVPLTQFEKAFNPNKGADFQEKFAFPRPSFNDKLVFYCRSGKRSEQAVQIAKKGGWQK